MSKAYKALPPVEKLRRLLRYDPETGELWWKVRPSARARLDLPAGYLSRVGYVQVRVHKVLYLAHRIAWAISTGQDPCEMTVDHADRDKTNNRFTNLRLATMANQSHNTRKNSPSGYKGVSRMAGRVKGWRARIRDGAKCRTLGYFSTPEEAYAAYCAAAAKLHGEFSSEPLP